MCGSPPAGTWPPSSGCSWAGGAPILRRCGPSCTTCLWTACRRPARSICSAWPTRWAARTTGRCAPTATWPPSGRPAAGPRHRTGWRTGRRWAGCGDAPTRAPGLGRRPMAAATARLGSSARCCRRAGRRRSRSPGAASRLAGRRARPRSGGRGRRARAQRDTEVLRHAPPGSRFDCAARQVRSLLASARRCRHRRGASTLRDAHPFVQALWPGARPSGWPPPTANAWLDEHLGDDAACGGLVGCDGAAGRIDSVGGPAQRAATCAAASWPVGPVFVRPDLADRAAGPGGGLRAAALAHAHGEPTCTRLSPNTGGRPSDAKVAVLGALYGQTTVRGAQVLRRLEAAYPWPCLPRRRRPGRSGRREPAHLRRAPDPHVDGERKRGDRGTRGPQPGRRPGRTAARGLQGAAELFSVVGDCGRAPRRRFRVVLCLHDELLVHTPSRRRGGGAVCDDCLPGPPPLSPDDAVRFVSETSVIRRGRRQGMRRGPRPTSGPQPRGVPREVSSYLSGLPGITTWPLVGRQDELSCSTRTCSASRVNGGVGPRCRTSRLVAGWVSSPAGRAARWLPRQQSPATVPFGAFANWVPERGSTRQRLGIRAPRCAPRPPRDRGLCSPRDAQRPTRSAARCCLAEPHR